MRYLSLDELIELHGFILEQSEGATGIRDWGALESAAAQPQMTFGGQELYPTLADKAAAICFSIVMNHPFVDGNKRVGHGAMETFLVLNGHRLSADIDEQERLILALAAGEVSRGVFYDWVRTHIVVR